MKTPGSKALRRGRLSVPGAAYLVTKDASRPGTRVLIEGEAPGILIDWVLIAAKRGWFQPQAFVVMPDHYHLVLVLGENLTLQAAIGKVNENVSRLVKRATGLRDSLWQTGFHDHQIRPREDFQEYIDYVHRNPVKEGLVTRPEEWPYSSAHSNYVERVRRSWSESRRSPP
jgi:putative transposase